MKKTEIYLLAERTLAEEPKPKCQGCQQPLIRLRWNKKGDILICDNSACEYSHRPQGFVREYRETVEEVLGRSDYYKKEGRWLVK